MRRLITIELISQSKRCSSELILAEMRTFQSFLSFFENEQSGKLPPGSYDTKQRSLKIKSVTCQKIKQRSLKIKISDMSTQENCKELS